MHCLSALLISALFTLHATAGTTSCLNCNGGQVTEQLALDWATAVSPPCDSSAIGPTQREQFSVAAVALETLMSGDSNEHCREAFNDIFDNCIINGCASGSWSSDSSNKELYDGSVSFCSASGSE